MVNSILIAWLGRTDLRAVSESETVGLGPIAQAVITFNFRQIQLLSNYSEEENTGYVRWLSERTSIPICVRFVRLKSPTDYGEIYQAALSAVDDLIKAHQDIPDMWFHLSPGTPAMAAVWILLSKTRFPAVLIESSKEQGAKIVNLPFDISAEFLPDLLRLSDGKLKHLSVGLPPEAPEFEEILHRCSLMKDLITKARRVAPRTVPVLLEGESGTGKELFARAIHRASPRCDQPFIAINCGAISAELIESELFGHKKGAFTGAIGDHCGVFERARGGTLFLDEIGELPLNAQVKFLRVLQEGTFIPVGEERERKADVRILAATNRNLLAEVSAGRFREDLFYRLAVAVLLIPPLRERTGDLCLLIDSLLSKINQESRSEPGFQPKRLSPKARNALLQHPWPGNVRELQNTLRRAALWSNGPVIDIREIKESLLPVHQDQEEHILGRPLGSSLDLRSLMTQVARHYLLRALRQAGGNKSKAAELIGLPSYQTLTNWLEKYDVHIEE